MYTRHNARQAAVQALYQWDLTEQDAADIQPQFKQIHDLHNVDRKYLGKLLTAIPKCHAELEQLLQPFLDRKFSSIDPVERAILRVGTYELKYQDDVPTNVIINEVIELAKVFGAEHSYKFINGVMDKLARSLRSPVTKEK